MASRNGRISAGLSLFDGAARICESRDRGVTAAGAPSEARRPPVSQGAETGVQVFYILFMLLDRGKGVRKIFKIIESATKERRRVALPESGRRPRPRPRRPAQRKTGGRPSPPALRWTLAAIGQAAILRLRRRAAPEQTAAVGIETDSTMTSASPTEHERAHGLAVFAAATF